MHPLTRFCQIHAAPPTSPDLSTPAKNKGQELSCFVKKKKKRRKKCYCTSKRRKKVLKVRSRKEKIRNKRKTKVV
jgi:hypothetical protein